MAYYCIWWSSLIFQDLRLVQDIEPSILHLYALDLSTNRFLQALRNLCENMQATTALAAHRSFPPGSAALRSFPRWVSPQGPPTCIKPNVGSRTALQSSGTCPAPILPPDRRRRCPFIVQVRVTRNNVENEHVYQLCFDARCDSALRVSCGLQRLSDGICWRCYLYPFTPLAQVGSRLRFMLGPVTAGDPFSPSVAGQSH